MKRTVQTFRYLSKGFAVMTIIGFISMVSSVVVSELVFYFTDRYDGVMTARRGIEITAPFDMTAAIFSLLIGMLLFVINFKVSLANGISRKTYLLANLPAAALTAAAFAIFNRLLVLVYNPFRPIEMMSKLFYPAIDWFTLLLIQFALYFLLIVSGWLITLAYYRSSGWVHWAISLSPVVLYVVVRTANMQAALGDYFQAAMRVDRAAVTLLLYTAILCGPVYLLIRRAPLKE